MFIVQGRNGGMRASLPARKRDPPSRRERSSMSLPPMPSPSPQPVASLPEGGGSRRSHARRLTEGVSSPAQGAVPGSRLMPHPTGKEQTLPSPPQTVATPPLSGEAFVPPAPTVGPTNGRPPPRLRSWKSGGRAMLVPTPGHASPFFSWEKRKKGWRIRAGCEFAIPLFVYLIYAALRSQKRALAKVRG